MATKKLKSKRGFFENQDYSNSGYRLYVSKYGVTLTLNDCARSIEWEFGNPGDKHKRGKKKIAAIKKLVDEIYEHFHVE